MQVNKQMRPQLSPEARAGAPQVLRTVHDAVETPVVEPECGQGLVELMEACWAQEPVARPLFSNVLEMLQGMSPPSSSALLEVEVTTDAAYTGEDEHTPGMGDPVEEVHVTSMYMLAAIGVCEWSGCTMSHST